MTTYTKDPRVMAAKQAEALTGQGPPITLCDGHLVSNRGAWVPAMGEDDGSGGGAGGGVLVFQAAADKVLVKVSNDRGDAPWWAHLSPNRAEELAHLLLIAAARARRNE